MTNLTSSLRTRISAPTAASPPMPAPPGGAASHATDQPCDLSDEPAGDDGFCFDLCLPPLSVQRADRDELLPSTRACYFVDDEVPSAA